MPGIFINYRRDDAPGVAGRLFDYLSKNFPRGNLFMDVDAIKPGLDFVKQLDTQVSHCDVLLALIGPHWLGARDEKGERRLEGDRDYVRIEIASALKRDIPVIPVLIDGARMPAEEELPEDLASFARRHALELRHTRFAADADAIVSALKQYLPQPKTTWIWPTAAALFVCAAGIAAAVYFLALQTPSETKVAASPESEIAAPAGKEAAPTAVSPATAPGETTTDEAASPQSAVEEVRKQLEEARRKVEAMRPKANTAGNAAQIAAAETAGRLATISVVPGAPFDSVKATYPMAVGDKNDLKLPLDGIYFEFTEGDRVLRVIRAVNPFSGDINGVRLGNTADDVVAKMGRQPNHIAQVYGGSGYAYQMDGYTLRFDVDKSNKVVEIWQILDRD